MSYIVGFTPKGRKRRYYGKRDAYPTRVEAKADAFPSKTAATKRVAFAERTPRFDNVQLIRCEGWGRPAKKVRRARR